MPDRCPRCKREMTDIAMWWPMQIGNDELIHLCKDCAKEAMAIDKAYKEACAKAKRKWLSDTNIEIATLLPDAT